MNITITENNIIEYKRNNYQLHNQIIKIYDTDYKQYLISNNRKLYLYYFMTRYKMRNYKSSATTLQNYINTILSIADDYNDLFLMFLNYIRANYNTIATDNEIFTSYLIRTIYSSYIGFNAELVIYNSIATTGYTIISNSELDLRYKVDYLIKSTYHRLALQIKPYTALKSSYAMNNIAITEQHLTEYTTSFNINHYYILYDSETKQPLCYQISPYAYCYLISYNQLLLLSDNKQEQQKLIQGTGEALAKNINNICFVNDSFHNLIA